MTTTTISSGEFHRDAGKAKEAARKGPVFIADHGRPSHVLLSIEAYYEITGARANIVELLAMPHADNIDFEPPRLGGGLVRPVDLS